MIAFLDTEFTDLVIRPQLLSVGLVADCGGEREFYAEVTDRDRIHAASWFALAAVLPQFGKIAGAACTYGEMGARLSTFLGNLVALLQTGKYLELAYGYHLDWNFVDRAVRDARDRSWESIRRHIRPVNIYELTGNDGGKLAAEAYFKAQALAPFSRHHALCDARALRVAYEAGTRATVGPGQAIELLNVNGQAHPIAAG